MSLHAQVSNKLHTLVTLTEAGVIRVQRPDRLLRTAVTLIRWGATPAAGLRGIRPAVSRTRSALDRRARAAHLPARSTSAPTRWRTRSPTTASTRATTSRSWPATTAASSRRSSACSKLGAHALFMNTSFSGPQLTDVADREKPKAIIYDEEFAEVLADAGRRRKRYISWAEPDVGDEGPDARGADRARRPRRRDPAVGAGQGRDPHLRHDGDAEGRLAQPAEVARPRGRAAVADPAEGAREDDDRRAALPRLGLRALHARHGPVLDDRAQAQVRRGGDAVADRAARLHRARGRAGDAPAHPRAARRGARPLRPLGRQGRPGVGLRAAREPLGPLDGPLRRQPLQPLRLDRGRVGDDRHAAGPARGARHRRQAAARDRREDLRRRGQAGLEGRDRAASSSATTSSSRATPAAATRTSSTA